MSAHAVGRIGIGWVGLVAMAIIASGCSSFTKSDSERSMWPWSKSEPKPKMPARILTIWTDAVHHQAGQKAQRGFGGRIVFYEENGNDSIQVDGQLTIYVFPDEPERESSVPERKYVFGADELKRHYSKSSLGDSYSVWLPWDVVGGATRQLTLIARFDAQVGGTVMSEPAKKMLPGVTRRTETTEAGTVEAPEVSQAEISERQLRSALGPGPIGSSAGQLRPVPGDRSDEAALPLDGGDRIGERPVGTSARSVNQRTAAPRSIADFLKQDGRTPVRPAGGEWHEEAESGFVRPASHWETDLGPPAYESRRGESPTSHPRVETIDLGQLRSRGADAISVPNHLLQPWAAPIDLPTGAFVADPASENGGDGWSVGVGNPRLSTDLGGSTPQRSDNALVTYGRPGTAGLDRVDAVGGSMNGDVAAADDSAQETWPRVTRTLGSNRRSIAETRQQAIQSRPQHHRPQ